jgi:ubiquinone/menaquinone biosynthesis C-methylase UbiE
MKSKYDSVAQEYDQVRPGYPRELIDKLISASNLNIGSNILEIGAGTGKATMALAKKEYRIDCIEREPKMAEILKRKCEGLSNITITISDFETWAATDECRYDLVFSAQAFHWIGEETKYEKCRRLLKDEGHIGLFWYFSVVESEDTLDYLNSIFHKFSTGYACAGIKDFKRFLNNEKNKLRNSKCFKNVNGYIFEGAETNQDAGLFIKRFNTTSAFAALDEQAKMMINKELYEVINLNGGIVASRLIYFLLTADKI